MPKLVHQETFCCGFRKCVIAKIFDDGSVTLSDDDVEAGSVGTIKIRPEAADRLLELLSTRKK
jgi:hypothetical protein